jgi:hypothetical protein
VRRDRSLNGVANGRGSGCFTPFLENVVCLGSTAQKPFRSNVDNVQVLGYEIIQARNMLGLSVCKPNWFGKKTGYEKKSTLLSDIVFASCAG